MSHRVVALLAALLLLLHASGASAEFPEFRGLWLSRFEYAQTDAAEVNRMVDNAARLGVTDLIFQVRGQGDALYTSNYEPRSHLLSGDWDPLQTAIDRAHGHGINLHAWINAMPVWRDGTPPSTTTEPPHPFYHEPTYQVINSSGNPAPLRNGSYVVANPINQDWHDHVNNVVEDIVTNYDVDGLHLDYIRWLGDIGWNNLPQDAASLAAFTEATGKPATNRNHSSYLEFIRTRIGDLVESVSDTVHRVDADAEVSAAVWRDPDVGRNEVLQDYRQWLEEDYLDTVIPMIYLSPGNNHLFVPNIRNVMSIETNARVAPGIGSYLHTDADFTVSQLKLLERFDTDGATFFDYSSFFRNGEQGIETFAKVRDFLDTSGRDTVALADFEVGESYFETRPTLNTNMGRANARRVEDDAAIGNALQRITIDQTEGNWSLKHPAGIEFRGPVGTPDGNMPLMSDGYVGVWLKTETVGIEVSLAVDDQLPLPDRGRRQTLVADNEWHLYEWGLNNFDDWQIGATSDQVGAESVTIDSLQFFGNTDATILVDNVSHRPAGRLDLENHIDFDSDDELSASDLDRLVAAIVAGGRDETFELNGDGVVDLADRDLWLATAGTLTRGSPFLVGDADLNGTVEFADFLALSTNFSKPGTWSQGNFDAEGTVSFKDMLLLSKNFGASAGTQPVPEPTSLGLITITVGLIWFRQMPARGHRRRAA